MYYNSGFQKPFLRREDLKLLHQDPQKTIFVLPKLFRFFTLRYKLIADLQHRFI